MNCKEYKNLISELQNPDEAGNDVALAAHLAGCKDCQKAHKLEEKLRQSFALIAEEAPPAALARKILAIQTENLVASTGQWSLFTWLHQCFASVSFRLALTLWIVTLLSGGLLLRYIDYGGAKMQPAFEQPSGQLYDQSHEQSAKKEMQVAMQPVLPPKPSDTGISENKVANSRIAKLMAPEPPIAKTENANTTITKKSAPKQPIAETQIAHLRVSKPMAPASAISETRTSDFRMADASVSEEAPVAMNFSVDSEEADLVMKDARPADADFDDRLQFAAAPGVDRAACPAESETSAESFKMAGAIGGKVASSMRAKSFNVDKFKADIEKVDPRADEIFELLNRYKIKHVEGFIDLEKLAIECHIGGEKLGRLQPPTGFGWFLLIEADQKKIVLKKR